MCICVYVWLNRHRHTDRDGQIDKQMGICVPEFLSLRKTTYQNIQENNVSELSIHHKIRDFLALVPKKYSVTTIYMVYIVLSIMNNLAMITGEDCTSYMQTLHCFIEETMASTDLSILNFLYILKNKCMYRRKKLLFNYDLSHHTRPLYQHLDRIKRMRKKH